ncbi:MAG: type II toxin-antitoxin system PemK/MazF family toxin [Clostridia bacterium]|nr:type II toxin-antitoxin system PemK/MazF family toxin [Clostridia bacterium]MBQ5837133.1 type II toxin-antitoxin system PemK/MazF family toxin [Clostridia bacterium]
MQNGGESIRRGDIYYADLSPVVGSEQGGVRPVLIVQNDMGNRYSPTVIAAAITSRTGKTKLPTHIEVSADNGSTSENCGLAKNSVILLEQIRTIDKKRLKERMGKLDDRTMQQVDSAIGISFGLN